MDRRRILKALLRYPKKLLYKSAKANNSASGKARVEARVEARKKREEEYAEDETPDYADAEQEYDSEDMRQRVRAHTARQAKKGIPEPESKSSKASGDSVPPGLVIEQIMKDRPDLTQKEIEDIGGG